MSTDRVTVVVPTYNERENLAELCQVITDAGYRLMVVDDASPDGTGVLADEIAAVNQLVQVLHRSTREGLGPAYGHAFDILLASDTTDVIIEMDADFSHDPADLPRLVSAVNAGADLAIGSRYVPGGSTPDWPLPRKLISRGGNWYARTMLGIKVKDATAGYRAFRSSALRSLPYGDAQASGYGFQVEMAWRAHQQGLVIVEIPVSFRDRTRGSSKMGPGIVLEAMWLVTAWGLARLFRRRK